MILCFMKHFERKVADLAGDWRFRSEDNQAVTSVFRAVEQLCMEISNSKDRLDLVRDDIDSIKKRLQELESKVEGFRTNLDGAPLGTNPPPAVTSDRLFNANDLQNSYRHLYEELQQLRRSLPVRVTKLEDSVAEHNRILTEQNIAIAELTSTSYDGTLLWKIPNVTKWLRFGNEPMNSPYFYTSQYGYKMQMKLLRRDSHIALDFALKRGEFDALLCWPFEQKITVMIVDQEKSEDLKYQIDPDGRAAFKKPTSDVCTPSACTGFRWQISDLSDHAYIVEDTMFIKVTVDTSGL